MYSPFIVVILVNASGTKATSNQFDAHTPLIEIDVREPSFRLSPLAGK